MTKGYKSSSCQKKHSQNDYSVIERKNPICGILAFNNLLSKKVFADDVHLVIKTTNSHADPDGAKLLSETLSTIDPSKVTLIEECLTKHDMLQLINSCDSVVSVHRSEGFGLHLAEAMAMGKDIIATNWSGNTDFLNHGNSFPVNYDLIKLGDTFGPYRMGNTWANPRLDDVVKQMEKVVLINKQKKIISPNFNEINNQLSINQISKKMKYRMRYINLYLAKRF